MFIQTQHVSAIAGNSNCGYCAISGNTEKVEILVVCSTRRGLWPAARGLRPAAKYEPALILVDIRVFGQTINFI